MPFSKTLKAYSLSLLMAGVAITGAVSLSAPQAIAAPVYDKMPESFFDPAGDKLLKDNPNAKKYWAEIKKDNPKWDKYLPASIKKLIAQKKDKIIKITVDEVENIPYNTLKEFVLYETDSLGIYYLTMKVHSVYVYPLTLGAADWIAPEKTPAVNPQTGKPYIILSEKVKKDLSKEETVYFETLAEVLNENLHYMLSPIPQLSLKEMSKGAYLGKFLLIPTLFRPTAFEDINTNPMFQDLPGEESMSSKNIREHRKIPFKDMSEQHRSESYLKEVFAGGNTLKFELQKRLGAPVWQIKTDFPDVQVKFAAPLCDGMSLVGGYGLGYPFSIVPLTLAAQIEKGKQQNLFLKFTYKKYFDSMAYSFKILNNDWSAEMARDENASPTRQKALKEIDRQLQSFIQQAEKVLARQKNTWQKPDQTIEHAKSVVKEKIPYSLLIPNAVPKQIRRGRTPTHATENREYGN